MKFVLAAILAACLCAPVVARAAVPAWEQLATEGETVTLAAPATVRYGAGAAWVSRDFQAGQLVCGNGTFGDPIPGTVKSCQRARSAEAEPPACYPDVRLKPYVYTVSVDPVRFSGNTYVSAWTCKTATGYRNYIYAWSAQSIGKWLMDAVAGTLDEAAAREWCKTNCLPLTAEQMTNARALVAGRLASAKVSASGTATTRPVYSVSGTTRTIVPNARVAIGEACDIGMRLGTTSYFSVAGKPNVAVAGSYPALGDVYAICTFVAPSGVND